MSMFTCRLNLKFVVCFGVCFIAVQVIIFTLLSKLQSFGAFHDDLLAFNEIGAKIGIVIFIFEPTVLNQLKESYSLVTDDGNYLPSKIVTLAVDVSHLGNATSFYIQVLPSLYSKRFLVETFFDNSLHPQFPDWPRGIFARRNSAPFVIHFLHSYEDNSWWFGSLQSDSNFRHKIRRFGFEESNIFPDDGLLTKFRLHALKVNGYDTPNLWGPKYPSDFIKNFKHSKFLKCNVTRALTYEKLLNPTNEKDKAKASHFTHQVTKLLSLVKTVFDGLGIPFWISSGTCLGYFRHCYVIPHSKDVDIGVFASDFSEDIITGLEKQQIKLRLWFGELNDSLELSFFYKNNIKLDIFFFYEDNDVMWNGGTQLRTGKKFKYTFPKFDLCWTIFLGLKLRIPCETETYIKSNYGPSWHTPVVAWDWKTSPYNVQENGIWPLDKRKFVIRVFEDP